MKPFELVASVATTLAALLLVSACGAETADPAGPGGPGGPGDPVDTMARCLAGGELAEAAAIENGHGAIVRLALASTGQVALGSADGSLKLWSIPTGEEAALAEGLAAVYDAAFGEGRPVASALAYGADGSELLSGDDRGVVQVWSVASGEPTATTELGAAPIVALAGSADGTRVAMADDSYGGNMHVWLPGDGERMGPLETRLWGTTAVAFLPDGALVTAGDEYGTAMLELRAADAPRVAASTWFAPQRYGQLHDLAISADGGRIVTGGAGVLAVFAGTSVTTPLFEAALDHDVVALALTPGEDHVITLGADGFVRLVELEGLTERSRWPLTGAVGLRVDAASGQLVTAGADGMIRLSACRE